jgi:molybdate transport system substrate-binding protein
MEKRVVSKAGKCVLFLAGLCLGEGISHVAAADLVIAASPSVSVPLEALARAYEASHPQTRVRLYYDRALDLRRTIASIQQDGRHFIGTGEVSLVAPGDDELLDRLEQKYYVLPGSRQVYAVNRVVLVAPESLVEAPSSFDAVAADGRLRLAVADPHDTALGRETRELLETLGLVGALEGRVDVAADARGVLDHVLNGQADVGIVSGADAARERDRVRVVATAPGDRPASKTHSIAMERYCPDRARSGEFLRFIHTEAARAAIRQVGYEMVEARKELVP